MGVATGYGRQKHWHAGGTFDGLNKVHETDFKFGPNADFIFAANDFNGRCYASATVTASASVAKPLTATSAGSADATILRKIGGAFPIYGFVKHWNYGRAANGLLKESFGANAHWLSGLTEGDLFPPTLAGRAYGLSSATANASVARPVSGSSAGLSVAYILRKIGGARNPDGDQKNWHNGQTFFAIIGTDSVKFDRTLFQDQTLWIAGLPTPDILPFEAEVVASSPIKLIYPRAQTKRQMSGWPSSIKIVSARPPSKRSSS